MHTNVSLFSAGVKRACCDFLESQLDPSNCLGIRDFAETHNCLDLMQAAELFSQKHFSEVVQHEEFMLLSQTEVEKLIKCDEIQVWKLDVTSYCQLYCRGCLIWTLSITKCVFWNTIMTLHPDISVYIPAETVIVKIRVKLPVKYLDWNSVVSTEFDVHSFLIVFHLSVKRKEQVPTCCNLSQWAPPVPLTFADWTDNENCREENLI